MSINPFSILAETVSPLTIQIFVLAMLALIVVGTVIQMISRQPCRPGLPSPLSKCVAFWQTWLSEKATSTQLPVSNHLLAPPSSACTCAWMSRSCSGSGSAGPAPQFGTLWPILRHNASAAY